MQRYIHEVYRGEGCVMDANSDLPSEDKIRQAVRVTLAANVQFHTGMRRCQAAATDLSTHGARVTSAHLLRSGDRFFLKLATLDALEAEVMWAEGFEAGCRFIRPLHPAAFDAMVRTP